uniref:NADH-ubiquinone oxidoreductase chain 4 n=1 Tax=Kolla paulula TaxID=700811 RepID=A0A8K1VCL1_9HEMI|nr:NADH dehydrogenase subunit 4 [Kolla paulula]
MKFIFFMFFMIPLIFTTNFWNLIQFFFVFIIFLMVFLNVDSFYCSISYGLGIDYFSFGLIILSMLISSLMFLSSHKVYLGFNSSMFIIMNMILCFCLVFVFSVTNMFMMYLFFEFSLIPLLVLIFGFGYQPERLISGLYLFFYTLFASLPLLIIIMYIYTNFHSVFFDLFFDLNLSFILHFCMIFAFLVKMPMFMVHFWLPKAHVEAPIAGSMILAGLMLKIGGYGIIRFMFICEGSFFGYGYIWYSFCLVGTFLVSMICLIQGDMKCLIAYSSVAHMGMSLMGMLCMTKFGLLGSYFMMIGHGLCSSGLFCLANICYERLLSRSFFLGKGMINYMPSMSFMWFMFCCFNMSCPPSINFISEIFIMSSMICFWSWSFIYIFFISFFSACFSFYLFSFSQHGKFHNVYSFSMNSVCEYLLMFIHLFPLIFIVLILSSFLN